MAGTRFIIKKNDIIIKLKEAALKTIKTREEALTKAGLQGLNWMVNGSPNERVVPPIKTGMLRGSGSIFVGNKFISATPDKSGYGTPNTSYSGKDNTITWGFNTDYAARMHESNWNPGKYSKQSKDVGNKWIRKHLDADKELLFDFIAKTYQKNF